MTDNAWPGVTDKNLTVINRPGSYRFAIRPKWVIGHLIVIAITISFINLGFWQLSRLDEKKTLNSLVAQRMEEPTKPLASLIKPTNDIDDPQINQIVHRRVRVTGSFDQKAEVLVRSRSLNGLAGYHVLTPLLEKKGTAVLINRGWVQNPDSARTAPPGTVEVTGLVLATQRRGSIGPTDPPNGVVSELARSDIERVQRQYRLDLYPVIVQLVTAKPTASLDMPIVLPPPTQDEVNHLSYALQWFAFTAIAIIGWAALLRRTAASK